MHAYRKKEKTCLEWEAKSLGQARCWLEAAMAQAKAHRLAVGSLAASCPEQSACDGAPGQNSQLWSTLDELDCRRNYHSALFTSIAISLLRSDFCGKGYRRSVSGSIYSTNTALAQFVQFVHETTPKGNDDWVVMKEVSCDHGVRHAIKTIDYEHQ